MGVGGGAIELVVANDERESLSNEWTEPDNSPGSSGCHAIRSEGTDCSLMFSTH